ncbi:NAD synthetase [Synechococcus sp. KORDI-52]|uniref:NAD+ synthase n=1 Tax=Synechococcus sp. KORDI-52 TaxID=585425 RepID=UPI0004E08555|nr:NAD+ synthase [Synechococcus sp. KORDI-52]AII48535.1 NAD synthetase [Synechococcus sp. KORDI-52]
MRIALAQLNPVVGDFEGNAKRILEAVRKAEEQGVELVLTPELSLWGYPPRDQLLEPSRIQQQDTVLQWLVNQLKSSVTLLVGAALPAEDARSPRLLNGVVLVNRLGWRPIAHKQLLPSYDVFDERRYFRPGHGPCLLTLPSGERLGLTICEDLWVDDGLQRERLAGPDPIDQLIPEQPDLVINLAASPFDAAKPALRRQLAAAAARRLNCPLIYLNQVGGNDELVFDGASFVVGAGGSVQLELPVCEEHLAVWDSDQPAPIQFQPIDPLERLFRALVLGVRDYAQKCGFKKALLGLSGGIDSALVAVIATAALGNEAVSALLMPSPWSSAGSIDDALALAARLGLQSNTVPIAGLMEGYDLALTAPLGEEPQGVTAENLQSRIRGTLLMAVANQQGQLLLTTGNKSELAVGYCTLYGDMNGGLAVIGDLYKTSVFALCDWLDSAAAQNCRRALGLPQQGDLVGEAIRRKPPSAELRPNQKDSDSLPDYNALDALLKALIQERQSGTTLVNAGHDPDLVERVERLLKRAEFKRRQAAPLLKVSPQAFGSGWRLPIAAA